MKTQNLRPLLVLCFIVGVLIPSYAQTNKRTWSIGPELGANFSKSGLDANETDYITGLHVGGFVTYNIGNSHAYTAKILYSQKGAHDAESNSTTQLNYIEIPVVVRLFFNRNGVVRPTIFGGPSFGFLTGARGKIGSGEFGSIDDYEDFYNTFDAGIGIGFGLNIKVNDGIFFIVDSQYTYGFTDVSKSGTDVNNQAIAISAGLSFGIGN